MRSTAFLLTACMGLSILNGCLTVGRDFRSDDLSWLVPRTTTSEEIHEQLGEPFRTGVDSGEPTWTYAYYKYRIFGDTRTKDLVIYFDGNGKVTSYTFNTSFPEEKRRMMTRPAP